MRQRTSTLMMSAGLLMLAACGGGAPAGGSAADAAPAGDAAGAAAMAAVTQPMDLTEQDVEGYVSILEEFKSLGQRVGDDGDISTIGAAIVANTAAHAIVRKHGYNDLVRFQRVAYNIGAAMAANEMGDNAADLEASKQQLEAMKSQLPKEQYDMMVQAHEHMTKMVAGQSAGNKALVARFADRIHAASQN